MNYLCAVTILLFSSSALEAQQIVYNRADSVKTAGILNKTKAFSSGGNKMAFIGKQFLGIPYVANTLENGETERLAINLHGLDCTTFVETLAALAIASRKNNPGFNDFAAALQSLRYRDGKLDGYPSRLHYFSDWIQNNVDKGLIEDVTAEKGTSSLVLNLFFMTAHPDKYPHLMNNPLNIGKVKEAERNLRGKEIRYFAKTDLDNPRITQNIRDGDIIAILTNIKGLDISHVGIAAYRNGELHLLHASSKHKKVLVEGASLYSQLKANKAQIGIRVLRLK